MWIKFLSENFLITASQVVHTLLWFYLGNNFFPQLPEGFLLANGLTVEKSTFWFLILCVWLVFIFWKQLRASLSPRCLKFHSDVSWRGLFLFWHLTGMHLRVVSNLYCVRDSVGSFNLEKLIFQLWKNFNNISLLISSLSFSGLVLWNSSRLVFWYF